MILQFRHAAAGLLLAVVLLPAWAQPLRLVIPAIAPGSEGHTAYFPRLLQLAMEKTEPRDGPFLISHYDYDLTVPRRQLELQRKGAINVMWAATNHQREEELLPVRVSLLRELNDYRPFLIRRGDEMRFRQVHSLDDLRKLRAGAGVDWNSVDVMRYNGLPVETPISYGALFPMLRAKRFDYMPRGAHEAWTEEKVQQGLMVEATIFLHYRAPFYFFVSRDDTALAERIEHGLKLAMADGSFDRLLNSYPDFRRGLAEIAARKRTVFELDLPILRPPAGGS